jgi:hypothetical protein
MTANRRTYTCCGFSNPCHLLRRNVMAAAVLTRPGAKSHLSASTRPWPGSDARRPRSVLPPSPAERTSRAPSSTTTSKPEPQSPQRRPRLIRDAGDRQSRTLAEQDAEREATWRERALNAEADQPSAVPGPTSRMRAVGPHPADPAASTARRGTGLLAGGDGQADGHHTSVMSCCNSVSGPAAGRKPVPGLPDGLDDFPRRAVDAAVAHATETAPEAVTALTLVHHDGRPCR